MAAAYRLVVSSVSCYSSVVVDRRAQSHAVHYCSGPCGVLSQGLDCTVAHRGTCLALLDTSEHTQTFTHNPTRNSPHQTSDMCKTGITMDTCSNGSVGVPNDPLYNSVYSLMCEDSPPWRVKKGNTSTGFSPERPLQSSASLKDITGEAINLASGKLKEFSFEKLRLSTSHVTFRKGRKVRPDSYSRRSTDLDIIYGNFTGGIGGSGNGNVTGSGNVPGNTNDENLPPFSDTTKLLKGSSPAIVTTGSGSLSSTSLSSVSRAGGGSTGSLSSTCSGSLEAGLNTVASLYLNSLADESLITRLLEKTRAGEEGGVGGSGGEDIRACLDILVKCSEDLKKCTDIIKQCIRRKSPGGGGEDGGASPETVYKAVMARLSSYLKKLPLELEGAGLGSVAGTGGQGSGLGGHSELAELVSSLHMLQQAAVPFSPMFGNDQPPRYEDVVQNPPLPKTKATPPSSLTSTPSSSSSSPKFMLPSSSLATDSSPSPSTTPETAGRQNVQTNGLQLPHSPSLHAPATSAPPSQAHAPPSQTQAALARTHTPAVSHMEALFIEEDADLGRGLDKTPRHTHSHAHTHLHAPTRSLTHAHSRNGTAFSPHTPPSSAHTHLSPNLPHAHTPHTLRSPGEALTYSPTSKHTPPVSHRDDDIDRLLMDLECLSQSMGRERELERERETEREPPLPAKTRKRGAGQGNTSPQTLTSHQTQAQINPQADRPVAISHIAVNRQASRTTLGSPSPLPQEGSVVGLEEEEDGALLLRILESIESFAQELVDSGASPGSTGKSGAHSKEKEVMRLLQDTLAAAGKTDSTPQARRPASPSPDPDGPAAGPVPMPQPVSTAPTPVPVHTRITLAESVAKPQALPSVIPIPVPPPAVIPSPIPAPTAIATPVPPPTVAPTPVPTPAARLAGTATPERTDGPRAEESTGPAEATPPPVVTPGQPPTPAADPAPGAAVAAPPVAARNLVDPSNGLAIRDTGSTLLIQQTPEVIRVQSNKQDKKPSTPPPTPLSPTPSVPTPCRTPSPPPTPVVLTPPPPPPALNIPRFYYPRGLPGATTANHNAAITAVELAFTEFEEEKADIYEMGKIAKACGCPLYWKAAMFNGAGGERTGFVSVHSFIATWRKLLHSCYDDSSKFIYLLAKPGCTYLDQEDFIPLLQDIVDTHPGLTFLKDAPEFHSRYITTVIQRIFYVVNRSWTGRITMTELRRSNFLQTLALLEEEDDINQITDYFSYEHFYVIYCKFWELDTDHDLYIDPKDLARYNDHASSSRIIERLFSGAVTRGSSVQREGRMSYAEFVWFLLSEEDKKNSTSIEYWFRCMDTDGDGVLSMFELEFFYEEQCARMEAMGIEPLPFTDLLCQMLDLVKPEVQGKITLSDLKRCRMAHIFFDTFFNLEKYLDHEQRDPFALQKDIDSESPEPSDWDKYASEEYEILVAEETANEQLHDGSFDDDYEEAELPIQGEMVGNKMDKLVITDLSA
ncbi:serine/threonine-protein phosphatase 2A regulatory subunit B'' subunit alpha isoform X1 [Esox lucius]|uniref:EF-hand domain-containing protein n=1 Tax=Esox lucius TaxID=8010 RepID=A0A3P8ZNB4_ESOLU|nr:serine/threonine-protein phosphatase 2A regulatory subunit B'' subunit alpha isoform X1 [Esox lucius]